MRIRLTERQLQWLDDHNVFFFNNVPAFGIRGNRLSAGDTLQFHDHVVVEPYSGIFSGNTLCEIGSMSYSHSDVPEDMKIGRYCSLAHGISYPRFRHPVEYLSTSMFTFSPNPEFVQRFIRDHRPDYRNFHPNLQKGGIDIGNDVWIGQNVTLNPGISVGTGSVIAVNSVVTRDVAPYTIVGGNPATFIRMRFDEGVVERLLSSEWWNYKFTDFAGLDVRNPARFCDGFERRKPELEAYTPRSIRLADLPSVA